MKRIVLFCSIFMCAGYSQVRWSLDGVRISVASSCQQNAQCVSDMNYGAIVAWEDNRYNSMAYDIFAQRVDSSGNLLWTPGGVPVCVDVLYSQENIAMCSDEAGGAIIVWQDYRNPTGPDLYAQRIDGNGTCLWQANGVPVCTAPGIQMRQQLISDGGNGAIIVWADDRPPNPPGYRDIYGQRVDNMGNIRWESNGVPICTTQCVAFYPSILSDKNNGVFIAWDDGRDTIIPQTNLYLQRIDGLGNHYLPITGKLLFYDSVTQYFPKLAPSVQNTMILIWQDYRGSQTSGADIYALRIDTLGNALWDSTGLPVCTADSSQDHFYSNLVADGLGGATISWYDRRNGNPDVYGQRIDVNGNQVWRTNGIPVCSLPGVQYEGPGVSDDSMGVIFKWPDDRNGLYEEYLQRIGPDGIERWTPQGVRACTVSVANRAGGSALCSDGSGGVITGWTDPRYGTIDLDIWGQRLNDGHAPGVTENGPISMNIDFGLQILPNPFSHTTNIRCMIQDIGCMIQNPGLTIYDATGRIVKPFNLESWIVNRESAIWWDGCDYAGKQLPAGVYFCRFSVADKTIVRKVVLLKE